MTGEETQNQPAQAAPETKETTKKSSEQWSLTALKAKGEKAWNALKEGFKKDSGVLAKLSAIPNFFRAFFEDIEVVETEEQKQNTERAAEAGSVLKNVDAKTAAQSLSSAFETTDKDGKTVEPAPIVTEVVTVAYDAAKNLDTARTEGKKAKDGETMGVLAQVADKLDPKKNPEKKGLSTEEQKLVFGYGGRLIAALIDKYPDKANFKKALDDFDKSTEGAPVGLHTFRTESFKGLFAGGDQMKIFDPLINKLGFWEKGKLLAGFASKVFVSDLKVGKIPETLVDASAKILPNTPETGRTELLKTVGQILAQQELGTTFPTNQQLTDIIFAVDKKDLAELSNLFA